MRAVKLCTSVLAVFLAINTLSARPQTDTPSEVGDGQQLFIATCAVCHATDSFSAANINRQIGATIQNLERNKAHYSMVNRFTKAKMVHYFQDKGAKVHFNHMQIEDPDLYQKTGQKELLVTNYCYVCRISIFTSFIY